MKPVEESATADLTGVENAMASLATLRTWTTRGGIGAAGVGLALLGAPWAAAEPELTPEDSPAPLAMVVPAPALPADGAIAAAASGVTAAAASGVAAVAPLSAALPEGVAHLPTPDSLPPGTTSDPTEGRTMGYIRDLWHAVRTQDVTMSDAFLLFAQRPMDANAPLGAMSPHNDPLVVDGALVPAPGAEAPVVAAPPAPPTP